MTHVGIYVGSTGGQAFVVDVPHAGADVRVEAFPTTVGCYLGHRCLVGRLPQLGERRVTWIRYSSALSRNNKNLGLVRICS